jgi:hypothetical protein
VYGADPGVRRELDPIPPFQLKVECVNDFETTLVRI